MNALISTLIFIGIIFLASRSVKNRKEKLDEKAEAYAAERNSKGTIVYRIPTEEKMDGEDDEEFGELQIRQGNRKHALIMMTVMLAIVLLAIYSTCAGGIGSDAASVIALIAAFIPYIIMMTCIFVFYSHRTYVLYFERGMVVSSMFSKKRFSYNDILRMTKTYTSYRGSMNRVESFKIILMDRTSVLVSGMSYKFADWHIETLLENLFVGKDKIQLF